MAAGAIAVVLDWLLLTRLRRVKAPELSSLMVTLGGVLALYAALTAWLGTEIRRLPPETDLAPRRSMSATSGSRRRSC